MPVSITERAAARHHEPPTRHDPHELIRTLGDVELPAIGQWTIGRGQRVTLTRRGLRRRALEALVHDGTFTVRDDLAGSPLDLVLSIPDAAGQRVTISSRSGAIEVGYRGVFRQRGRPPSMWLDLHATLELPDLADVLGRGEILLNAALNLNPSFPRAA